MNTENTTSSAAANLPPQDNPANAASPTGQAGHMPAQQRAKRNIAALTFAVIYLLIGMGATVAALGVYIPPWTLMLVILGGAGIILLISSLLEARS